MNFTLKRKKAYSEKRQPTGTGDMHGLNSFVAQFFVFHGEKYLGWDCFDKSRVKVGKSHDADLVLADDLIADIQAEFVIKGNRIIVSDEGGNGALFVNDKTVSNCIIGPFDFIRIGNYTIKIKLKKIESTDADYGPSLSETGEFRVDADTRRRGLTVTGEIDLTRDTTAASEPERDATAVADPKPMAQVAEDDLEFVDIEEIVNENLAELYDDASDDVVVEVLEVNPLEEMPITEAPSTTSGDTSEPAFEFDLDDSGHDPSDTIVTTEAASDEDEDWFLPDTDDDTMTWDDFVKKLPAKSPKTVSPAPVEHATDSIEKTDTVKDPQPGTTVITKKKAETPPAPKQPKPVEPKLKEAPVKAETPAPTVEKNSFPASFFTVIVDEEDEAEEADDFPADFSLREKLVGNSQEGGRSFTGEKVLEVIKFRGDSVVEIKHLKHNESWSVIEDNDVYCRVHNSEKQGQALVFNKPLLGKINVSQGKELATSQKKSLGSVLGRQETYTSVIPSKGETLISDGYYDVVLRQTFITAPPVVVDTRAQLPIQQRVLKSQGFKYTMWALAFHVILMIILPLSITLPDKDAMTDPETHFVVIETENIHKPEKPKPKPIPKPVAPVPKPKEPEKKIAEKKPPKTGTQMASVRKKPVKSKKQDAPKAGGGHKGNLVNRDVNQVGLLGSLGLKKGIGVKPTEALAAVTNIDAVTSTHSREATIKVGGLIGDLGDSKIAIPNGGVVNTKGSAGVLRSAGIGGKGSVAALSAGNTGKRGVVGAVSAPLTKKVKVRGGGISMEAVKKIIDENMAEIQYCYETALISDPTLMGKVVFEWKILTSGRVGEVKIKSSSIRSSEIHSCIKAAIKTWQFPAPKGGQAVLVSYPFVFDVTGF